MTKLSDIWDGDFKAGDLVRWTLMDGWCEGYVTAPLDAMTVIRAHNWPAADNALRVGLCVYPRTGTLRAVPPDILVGDHVMWTPPSDCPYYGLHLKGVVSAVVADRPLIRVQTLYDSHFGVIAIAEWPPNLRLGAVIDTGVAPGIVQRWPRLPPDAVPLRAGDYVRWEAPEPDNWVEGEIATICGFEFDIAIHVEGRSRTGLGGTQPFGISLGYTVRRIPRPNPEPKPEILLAGDYVRWDNPLFPAGQVWIEGELVLNPVNHARIRIDDFRGQGSEWSRGAHTDVRVEPGSLRRIPRPGVGLRPQREPMRDEMIKERHTEPDPLDVMYDGYTLRHLLGWDEAFRRRDALPVKRWLTPAQRAAISAHWSAQLRAKIAASTERERNRVRVDLQDID
jgi:hypothetical protein